MGITVNVEDSILLREPIDRAFRAGKVEGSVEGIASFVAKALRGRFGGEVPDGLEEHLSDLKPEVLLSMADRIIAARSAEDVLGTHMPGVAQKP